MNGDGYGASAGRSPVQGLNSSSVAVAAPPAPVSEPAIIALFGLGLVGIGFARLRQS
ncbi:MAG: hypothetical protein ACI9C4_002503 [Paraglaciecola sp.]|jgi:hypothetical protein